MTNYQGNLLQRAFWRVTCGSFDKIEVQANLAAGGLLIHLPKMPVRALVGGPYRLKPADIPGIKLEASAPGDSAVLCGIPDFSIPTEGQINGALVQTAKLMREEEILYVGCTGGIGRTGLFMGCMVRLMQELGTYRPDIDPVEAVRRYYLRHAIETAEQKHFVRTVNLSEAVRDIKR